MLRDLLGADEHQQCEHGREHRRGEDPDLRLVDDLPLERDLGDQQREREADSPHRRAAERARELDRERQPAEARMRSGERRQPDPEELPDHEPEEDTQRDGRPDRAREQLGVDADAGARERKERDDDEARPRVQAVLEPLVRGDRTQHAASRGAGVLRGGLLAEETRDQGHLLQVLPLGGPGAHGQTHEHTGDRRVHARLRRRDPDRDREQRVERRPADPEAAEADERAEQHHRDGERREGKGLGVCEGDHDQHADVVGDHDGEDESTEPLGRPPACEREHPQRERGVRRHHHPPPVRRVGAAGEREVDRDWEQHSAHGGEQRRCRAASVPKLAHVELAAHLEPDHEEEDRHQPVVDPEVEVAFERPVAETEPELRRPERVVARPPR